MANTTTTIAQAEEMIRQRITSNDSKAITGQALQDVLLGITSGVKLKTEENSKNMVTKDEELRNALNVEAIARIGANEKMLKRIKGISSDSSAYTDPFRYLRNFTSEKDANGTITKHAIRIMQDALLDTLRHSDFNDSLPFIGHMRAHIEGVPIEAWNYVKNWNQGSNNGIFVQIVHTNFGLKKGVISSAATSEYHEYFRTVNVAMADGLVTNVTATEWKESTLTETDRTNIASIAFLGNFYSIDAASSQASTVQYAGNADYVILRFRIGGKGGLILQNVNGKSTEQYLFNDGKRYVRYVDFTSADRTAVKKVQAWKLDGVAYIFYDSAKRIIYQRNQWDENISGGGPSTLPLVSSQHAGLLSNTAFTHLSNFNIYEHSVPTATSVRLTFTKPLTGEAGVATLAAATSARAGVMTAADKTLLDTLGKTSKHLGTFSNREDALAAASTFAIVSDSSLCLLTAAVGASSSALNAIVILQQVQKNNNGSGTTMQYVFDGKQRYTRYIDHNASSVTSVQPLQQEGVRNLYFTQKGFIGLKDMWGTQVGSGFFLPDKTNVREDAANTTATSVGLVITSFLGTTKTATLGAVTSARAGLMTVGLYNELKKATTDINELTARLEAAERKITQLEQRLAAN